MPSENVDAAILLDVHRFWFEELIAGAADPADQVKIWFSRNDATDDAIRVRFEPALDAVAAQSWDLQALSPAERIGLVILLDQFPRNLFRDDGRAYAYDERAREIAQALIAGDLASFRPIERVFLYLPLEHSEAMADQDQSVALFEALQAEMPATEQAMYGSFVTFAEKHRDVIRRFGRFPHRNVDLGRTSTAEEAEFLKGGRGY
jgi:uncharacterized protein (DUF924 family)